MLLKSKDVQDKMRDGDKACSRILGVDTLHFIYMGFKSKNALCGICEAKGRRELQTKNSNKTFGYVYLDGQTLRNKKKHQNSTQT